MPLLLQPTTSTAAAVAEQNTFIMSTADPFEELLAPSKNNCLETLNKTETVYKPGEFFLLFCHIFLSNHFSPMTSIEFAIRESFGYHQKSAVSNREAQLQKR